jgi:Cu/Ag efflux protein CusF
MKRTTLAVPAALLLAIVWAAGWVSGCGSTKQAEQNPAPQANPAQAGQPGEHRYHLEGTVVSVDKPQQHLVIDHKDIPGFMSAMTMPYPVADAKVLDQVGPGDQITADVVQSDKGVNLENVVVVKKGGGGKPPISRW